MLRARPAVQQHDAAVGLHLQACALTRSFSSLPPRSRVDCRATSASSTAGSSATSRSRLPIAAGPEVGLSATGSAAPYSQRGRSVRLGRPLAAAGGASGKVWQRSAQRSPDQVCSRATQARPHLLGAERCS